MFGFNAPRARPGRQTLASAILRPADAVARLARARVGSGMAAIEAAGSPQPFSTERRPWLVRITSVGAGSQAAQYGWQAIAGDRGSPGSYLDLTGWTGTLGSDPAFEDNGNADVASGARVEVTRDFVTGRVRFQLDKC